MKTITIRSINAKISKWNDGSTRHEFHADIVKNVSIRIFGRYFTGTKPSDVVTVFDELLDEAIIAGGAAWLVLADKFEDVGYQYAETVRKFCEDLSRGGRSWESSVVAHVGQMREKIAQYVEFDRTFAMGDEVETGRYNLIYLDPITGISEKTISTTGRGEKSKRFDLHSFIATNWNLNTEAVYAQNSETSNYI